MRQHYSIVIWRAGFIKVFVMVVTASRSMAGGYNEIYSPATIYTVWDLHDKKVM
jgi:hypothetical protein